MQIVSDPKEFQELCLAARCQNQKTALVPTMGCLHRGHLELFKMAAGQADLAMASIFVNPAQFGPGEDLDAYPRQLKEDAAVAESAGIKLLFCPPADAMYSKNHCTWVEVKGLDEGLCGRDRPGHFRGVATVVAKLLILAMPDLAVFGQKDWQQLAIIRQMVLDLNLPVQIEGHPIVREDDGLALSSRNRYLSADERCQAPFLYKALKGMNEMVETGAINSAELCAAARSFIGSNMPDSSIDYLEIVDPVSLSPLADVQKPALAALAVRLGKARLIDNMTITGTF